MNDNKYLLDLHRQLSTTNNAIFWLTQRIEDKETQASDILREIQSINNSRSTYTTHKDISNDATPAEQYVEGKCIKITKKSRIAISQLPTIHTTWDQYIDNLDEWDMVLMQEKIDIDQKKLIKLLREKQDIIICSDRGAKGNVRSYGAALANGTTVLIAKMGRAYGYKP